MDEVVVLDVFTAASIGQADVIQGIRDEDVNSKNQSAWTPLMYASYYGHEKLVSLLLSKGADPSLGDGMGRSCMILAAMCGNDHVVSMLLKHAGKQQMKLQDHKGWNALFYAAYLGHQNVVRILLRSGDEPNARDTEHGFTPLMIACNEGHEIVVQCLLDFGGDVHAYSNGSDTARSLAHFKGNYKIVALLDGHICKRLWDDKLSVQLGPAAVARLMQQPNGNVRCSPFKKGEDRPDNLLVFLDGVGLAKYHKIFVEQDVDLGVFLTLNDGDLKEIGISLLGPRRKMTSAIARWHAQAPMRSTFETAYADKLEAEVQQMGVQFHKALLRIEELQKQVKQEKQLRYLVEGSLAEEKEFALNVGKLCQRAMDALRDDGDSNCLEEKEQMFHARNSRNAHLKPAKAVVKEMHALAKHRLQSLEQGSEKKP